MKSWKNAGKAALLAAASMVLLTGCSTSAGTLAEEYISGLSDILGSGSSAKTAAAVQTEDSTEKAKIKLDAPQNFTVSNDGEYSFDTVEGAVQYYIYLCDTEAVNDTDDYLYACQMDAQDGDTMTGSFSFDFKYGSYLAKVFSVSEDNTFSDATVLEYEHTGEIVVPRVAWSWDGAGTVTFDVVNVPAYEYSVIPNVEITLTNLDTNEQTTVLMDAVSDSAYLESALEAGKYSITARGVTDSAYVTNGETDVYTVAEEADFTGEAAESPDYEIRATYTSVAMFMIDFSTSFDTSKDAIEYTWANVLTASFTRDESQEDDWTEYYYIGEGTGTDGLHAEIAFKADGTCRMIARGGPYGGAMGGDRIAETGSDGYEWVVANGSWTEEDGVITFNVAE